MSPRLARRAALLGSVALIGFAVLFLRLWLLQVLSGDDYVSQAAQNTVRKIPIDAPRGDIVDRHGHVLVATRAAAVVQILPDELPATDPAARRLFGRLGHVIGLSPREIHTRVVQQLAVTPYAAVTVKTDVPRAAFDYLLERQDQFPGVRLGVEYVPTYPHHALAAQLLGSVREISPDELEQKRYKGLEQGAEIGVDGLEETYDAYLRGRDGFLRQRVDASGQPCDDPVQCKVRRVKPRQGHRLRLTLDLGLEKAATAALQRGIDAAAGNGADSGAFVAMDPRNGAVLAMGSLPSYDANLFAKPITQRTLDRLRSQGSGNPLLDRAIQGAYPTGSTFKLVSATAGLESGDVTPGRIIDDRGFATFGGRRFQNSGGTAYGPLDVVRAVVVSSDVFFYQVGYELYSEPGQILQGWARRFGFGHTTGIDLPGEFGGLVPDRQWRDAGYAKTQRCVKRHHIAITDPHAPYDCFPFIDRRYSAGDNVNLAVGQGDLQATPLQLATAYSALANGGTLVRPHLGAAIEDDHGALEQRLSAPPRGRVGFTRTTRHLILDGLRGAASEPGGTSADVFRGFPYPVYGKTGTAEHLGQPDQSWYACYVDDAAKPVVVAVTVEKGGFGAATAAPVARLILDSWFHLADNAFHAGESTTR